jgi:hypothetical protein
MKHRRLIFLPLLSWVLAIPGVAAADPDGLQRCRAMADPAARLACYDALPIAPPAQAAPAAGSSPPGAGSKASSPSFLERFGLESKPDPQRPDRLETHIAGRFTGWKANDRIKLANGQVWQIADGSQGALWIENPKVTIRRGTLGAFFMDVESTNRSPRVVRIE